ncbi:MAG: hypothetical protein AAF467_01365 [Actinomycetota bacterium]
MSRRRVVDLVISTVVALVVCGAAAATLDRIAFGPALLVMAAAAAAALGWPHADTQEVAPAALPGPPGEATTSPVHWDESAPSAAPTTAEVTAPAAAAVPLSAVAQPLALARYRRSSDASRRPQCPFCGRFEIVRTDVPQLHECLSCANRWHVADDEPWPATIGHPALSPTTDHHPPHDPRSIQ